MKKIKLTDKQIEIINDYVKEASQISHVSGIYLYVHEFHSENGLNINIGLQSIFDLSLEYNNKLIGQKIPSEISDEEYARFCNLSSKYEAIMKDASIFFGLSRMTDYCTQSASHISLLLGLSLATSSILFDRFGDIKTRKEELSKLYQPDEGYLQIENIDAITNNQNSSSKELQLKKKWKSS